MKYFTSLDIPPILGLKDEIYSLLNSNVIKWTTHKQICINTTPDQPDNYELGTGSLAYDWSNTISLQENGRDKIVVPKRQTTLQMTDFSVVCNVFKNTLVETAYRELTNRYSVGRVRLMNSYPKTCYSWHVDSTPRIHYVIDTSPGCHMVIEDEVMFMPVNTWWFTDTTKYHTAFNGSTQNRIHMVAEIV